MAGKVVNGIVFNNPNAAAEPSFTEKVYKKNENLHDLKKLFHYRWILFYNVGKLLYPYYYLLEVIPIEPMKLKIDGEYLSRTGKKAVQKPQFTISLIPRDTCECSRSQSFNPQCLRYN